MTPALQTRDLTVGYHSRRRRRVVLSGLNLTVHPGEFVCLLGANGSGKTTLMRTLTRTQRALAGSVEINGENIARMSHYDLARNVAVVLTERIAVGAMEAYQLVELGRYPHSGWSGLLSERDNQIVRESIAAVGAQHLARRDVNELSDGERQRIMIARALAQRPAVLLLDEPSAFLDVSARVEMIAMLRRLAREQNVSVVLSSHDLELALRTSDTIWLFDGTGGIKTGAPEDLLADGSVAAAFSGSGIVFDAEERAFKVRNTPHSKAFIEGDANRLGYATSALEREGYAVTGSIEESDVQVTISAVGWDAKGQGRDGRGKTFAELAHFVRKRGDTPAPSFLEPHP